MFLAIIGIAIQLPVGGGWVETHTILLAPYASSEDTRFCGLGDLDHDGAGDFALVTSLPEAGWTNPPSALHLYSGRTGARIWRVTAPGGDPLSGGVAPAGDANGDGITDVIVGGRDLHVGGMFYAGSVFVFSGADGSLISRADGQGSFERFGSTVAAMGDGDGDGIAEYFCGSPNANRAGVTSGAGGIYSAATGVMLHDLRGDAYGDSFGEAAASLGDWDGDAVPDLAVGAPHADLPGMEDAGCVILISGATGLEIQRWYGLSARDSFGRALVAVGDASGDGVEDLLVGAPTVSIHPGERSAGAAYLISGASRQILSSWHGRGFEANLGAGLAPAGDQDLDGHADFYLGAPGRRGGILRDAGQILLISGLTGTVLYVMTGPEEFSYWGSRLADGGDLDGDRSRHLMSVNDDRSLEEPRSGGAVRIFSLQPYLAAAEIEVSAAAGGTVNFDLDFPADAAGQIAQILISRSGTGPALVDGVEIPLTRDVLFERSLARSYPSFCTSFLSVLGPHGDAGARMDLAPGLLPPALIGTTLHFAAIARRLNGAITHVSRAYPLLIQP